MDKEVVKRQAQLWRSDMREKIDTRTHKDPGTSFAMDGGGPAISARIAEGRNRISGLELTRVEERAHAGLAQMAKEGELQAWGQFKVPHQ